MANHRALFACCVLALAGCPTVDLGDTPPDIGLCNPAKGIAYFQSDVWPKYFHPTDATRDCAKSGCHLMQRGMSLDPTPPIDYAKNYRAVQTYLNCGQPQAGSAYTKPSGFDGHGGGVILPNTGCPTSCSDPAVASFFTWFQ